MTHRPRGWAPPDSTCTYYLKKQKGPRRAPLLYYDKPNNGTEIVGERISALPLKPVINTVHVTSLPNPQGSYDCTLPLWTSTFPLEIQGYSVTPLKPTVASFKLLSVQGARTLPRPYRITHTPFFLTLRLFDKSTNSVLQGGLEPLDYPRTV